MALIQRVKGHGSKITEFGLFLCKFIDDLQSSYLEHGAEHQVSLLKEIKKIQKFESNR